MPATGRHSYQSVSKRAEPIGYVGLAYVSPRIKTLAVSYDDKHFAAPTWKTPSIKLIHRTPAILLLQ